MKGITQQVPEGLTAILYWTKELGLGVQITAEHHYGWPLEPDLYMLPLAGHARTVRRRTLLPFRARSGCPSHLKPSRVSNTVCYASVVNFL